MADLQELIRQKTDLERRISEVQAQTRSDAISRIYQLMHENGLSLADLSATAKRGPKTTADVKRPVAVKYKDGHGNQWTGRGLKPRWLVEALKSGKALEDFAV